MEGATAQRVLARVRDRGILVGAACAVAVALVAWPVRTLEPGVGGDWSWVAGLAYAAHHGMAFGDEIVWSYGPLGFLNTWYGPALYYGEVATLAWLYVALIQLLLAATLLLALRRSLHLALAAVVAAAVLALAPDRVPALALAWCVLFVTCDRDEPRDARIARLAGAFPYAIGALAGIALLGKLNQGVELLALAVIALVAVPRRRDALAFAGTLLATAAVGWVATGQGPGDVWPYVRDGAEVVAGYAAAMGTSDPEHGWALPAGIALAAAAVALAWDAGRALPGRRRWALPALALVYAGLTFKEGFVREDEGHLQVFFGDMLVLLAVLPLRAALRPVALAGALAAVVAFGAVGEVRDVTRAVDPYANVKAAADQLRTLASASRRDAIEAETRAKIEALYHVPPQVRAAVRGRSTMLWPYLYGEVAYAYELDLRPLPSFEPYAAYTPRLDRLGAELLASDRAPARILRAANGNAPALDNRHPAFEAPQTTLQILCRYRQVAEGAPWHALARIPNRCGAPRTLGTVSAAWGEPVAVPAPRRPDALVLARVEGAEPHGLETLTGLLVRPKRRWISLDGASYRLVPATAAEGLLLRVPPAADYPDQYALAPNPVSVAVGRDGGQPGGELRYTFVEVPIRPFAGGGPGPAPR